MKDGSKFDDGKTKDNLKHKLLWMGDKGTIIKLQIVSERAGSGQTLSEKNNNYVWTFIIFIYLIMVLNYYYYYYIFFLAFVLIQIFYLH